MRTAAWPANFPNVVTHTTLSNLRAHPMFAAAKAGSDEAADHIISNLAKTDKLAAIAQQFGHATVVPVRSKNALPAAYARQLGRMGMEVDDQIAKDDTLKRTDSAGANRMMQYPNFAGRVRTDKPYLMLDDVVTMGGTYNGLRRHIEKHGGSVVGATALAAAKYGHTLPPSFLPKLYEKFGEEAVRSFCARKGVDPSDLSSNEVFYLLRFKTLEGAAQRIGQSNPLAVVEGRPLHRRDFVQHGQDKAGGRKLHWIDTAALDAAWQKDDKGYYIPPGGGGAELKGRIPRFKEWLKRGLPIQVGSISVNAAGRASFDNGRHRTRALMDAGMSKVPVSISPESLQHARMCGLLPPIGSK